MSKNEIPYKIYLEEKEMPTGWYNVRADMKTKPAPLLNPATLQPMTAEELGAVFCEELVRQELDDRNPYIAIPQEILDFYKMYRPSPLVRAYCLEKKLQTPAKIYYKFEGNNTSGSHKLNSAIAQAYYAKKQGLKGVTTETGAGQWGTALSMACKKKLAFSVEGEKEEKGKKYEEELSVYCEQLAKMTAQVWNIRDKNMIALMADCFALMHCDFSSEELFWEDDTYRYEVHYPLRGDICEVVQSYTEERDYLTICEKRKRKRDTGEMVFDFYSDYFLYFIMDICID